MANCWSNKRWRQLELRRDRRCRERNYTARARGNRCSSENIQEATSWAGNTTVSKVFDDKKKGRERGGGKEDVLCRSQVAKWIENFPPKLLLLLLLPFPRWYFFLTLSRPAFSTSPSLGMELLFSRNFQVFSVEPPSERPSYDRFIIPPRLIRCCCSPSFSRSSIIVFENDDKMIKDKI